MIGVDQEREFQDYIKVNPQKPSMVVSEEVHSDLTGCHTLYIMVFQNIQSAGSNLTSSGEVVKVTPDPSKDSYRILARQFDTMLYKS